ncbi:MAG: HAD family hydrolase [Phaeodactylibacter sp.]|nr:HAD family hydrolase [Phaeodactylibacter sp.]MCB9049792.1 HAD family hydrolase [Lewinellaceae bacterium]
MKLVIFDVDGTLIYSEKKDSLAFAATYEKIYQRPFPTIDWRTYPHVTDTTIFDSVIRRHFGRSSSEGEVTHFQKHYVSLLQDNRRAAPDDYKEVPGARQAVAALGQDGGYLIGVATGGWKRSAEIKLQHVGITIDHRLFSGADGKAEREHIIEEVIGFAEDLHGGAFDKVVYIGDAIWDVRTTRNMQLDFIGVRRMGDFSLLQREGVRHVIRDYLDYEGFLQLLEVAMPPGERSQA